jgi:hypothetical protein
MLTEMKYAALAFSFFVAAVALWYVERDSEDYTPIVRVRSTDGLYITLLQARTAHRSGCTALLEHFQDSLPRTCAHCAVESSTCATSLEGIDRALAHGEPVPIYTVSASGIRAGLLGPPASARAECEAMATQLMRSGIQWAACVAPSPGPHSAL